MALNRQHDLHARRGRQNRLVAAILGGFVVLVFAVTLVKLSAGQVMEAFDHVVRPSLVEEANDY